MRALLYLVGRPSFGHDLTRLLGEAVGVCGEPPRRVRVCVSMLDKMSLPEGAPWEHYTREEAEEARECASLVVGWVEECARRLREGAEGEEGEEA